MSNFSVSVVIPTFNRHEPTARAVRSALAQSYAPREIVVLDDGSERPFDSISHGLDDKRVRVIRLERNRGAAAARQTGIEAASGNIISFLDSDDVWLPHKLETQLALLAATRCGEGPVAVVCGWVEHREGAAARTITPRESRSAVDFAAGCWFAPGSTLVVERKIFDIVGPFEPMLRRLEDYEWFLRFGLAGGRVVVEPSAGAIISVGRRSLTRDVRQASGLIEGRLAALCHPNVDNSFRRTAKAYLALEMAKAAQNEGLPVRMGLHLLHSLLLKPRVRPALNRWWTVRHRHAGAQV